MQKQNSKYIAIFLLASILVPGFAFALQAPDTLDEAKEQTLRTGEKIASDLPSILEDLWDTLVTPIWSTMWQWTQTTLWEQKVQPVVQNLIDRAKQILGREVEQRKPIIQQELQKEKQELAREIQSGKQGLWERFLDLFRKE